MIPLSLSLVAPTVQPEPPVIARSGESASPLGAARQRFSSLTAEPLLTIFYIPPGFSPHEVHESPSFFGWILPTLRTSEFTVLQIVGLDAAVVSALVQI